MTTPTTPPDTGAVDAALANWRQGDCVVGEQWFVYRTNLDNPLTDGAQKAAAGETDLAEVNARGFVVVSQSCDLVRSCSTRPFVEVSPLVESEERNIRSVKRGRLPRYVFVPGLEDQQLVGDLDRVMTVEKSVAAGWEQTKGCKNDQEMRALTQAIARKRTRFAFPDDFGELARQLQNRLIDKHERQSQEGEGLRALREVRVRAAPSWDDAKVHINFWFIREGDQPDFNGTSWDKLVEGWLKLIPPTGRFTVVDGIVTTLDDLTARDFVESDPLDLDHLSVVAR